MPRPASRPVFWGFVEGCVLISHLVTPNMPVRVIARLGRAPGTFLAATAAVAGQQMLGNQQKRLLD